MSDTVTPSESATALPADRADEPRNELLSSGSFTRRRVERTLQLAVAFGSAVVGGQSFVAALGNDEAGSWHLPLMLLLFVPLVALLVSMLVGRAITLACTTFVVAYLAVVVIWALVADPAHANVSSQPWIWYVTNVATMAAVMVMPMWLQVTATLGIPVLYFLARMVQVDFAPEFITPNLFDQSFSLCLGSILLLLTWLMRAAGSRVDRARASALAEYTKAAAVEAADAERLSMAALMHDSVMAALIAAARAETDRERDLTVQMAREALSGLADAESDERMALGQPISARLIARDLAAAAADFGAQIEIADPADVRVPGHVARAVTLAATQAIANSIQHAQAVGLQVTVTASEDRVLVEVADAGGGINMVGIPEDRLGIRASILARMASVGGKAKISSVPGRTVVSMSWHR